MRDRLAELWHWPLVYQKQEAYIRLLFDLAARWKDRYTHYKKEKNLLDYNDMEKYLRDLRWPTSNFVRGDIDGPIPLPVCG